MSLPNMNWDALAAWPPTPDSQTGGSSISASAGGSSSSNHKKRRIDAVQHDLFDYQQALYGLPQQFQQSQPLNSPQIQLSNGSSQQLPPLSSNQHLSPMHNSNRPLSPNIATQQLQQPPAFTQPPIQSQWQYLPQHPYEQESQQQTFMQISQPQHQQQQQQAFQQLQAQWQHPLPGMPLQQSFQQPLSQQLFQQSLPNKQYQSPQSTQQPPLQQNAQYSQTPQSAQPALPRTQSKPRKQPKPSPQQQHLPSPQQQLASPQQQFLPSPQQQFPPSPQQQFQPSPQQQFQPSPQQQHLPPPQQLLPTTQQQQLLSPQQHLLQSPQQQQLQSSQQQQLQAPQQQHPQAPQQHSPQPRQAHPPPQSQLQQQDFQIQSYLSQFQQQSPQGYQQQTVEQFESTPPQWQPPIQQQQPPLQQPQALPQQPVALPQQPLPQQQTPGQQTPGQQQYFDYNGLAYTWPAGEEFKFQNSEPTTPSSMPIQGQSTHIAAPSPSIQTPPSFLTQLRPPHLSSLPTPTSRPTSTHNSTPTSNSAKAKKPKVPRPSSASKSTLPRPKSQLSQATPNLPQVASQPSSRPMALPATPAAVRVPVPTQVPTPTVPTPAPEAIPTAPLLFHTAVSAHHSATYHLQQVFVPKDIQQGGMVRETRTGKVPFTHDPGGLNTALRLLVMALDLLRLGFYTPNLSDSERAAFGLEFATVAAKVLATEEPVKKLLTKEELAGVQIVIDHRRLLTDVEDVMTKTLAVARSPYLKHFRQGVELVSARLAFMKDKANHGKRIIKQALASTPREDMAHRYNLNLLYMNHLLKSSSVELLQVVKDFEADARTLGHQDVVLLAHVIRIRAHFSLRRWDSLLGTLDESEALFGTDEVISDGDPATASFRLVLLMHYLNMRALYCGRAADDQGAKKQLSRLYPIMDRALDKGMLSELRSSGGMVTIPLRALNGSMQHLLVQSTPINVLWALTYLSSVVARRDLLGYNAQCRTLNHTRAMRQYEHQTHPDDLWDSGFSFAHGVADAIELRHRVNKIRAEMMMEEALALLCRSSFEEVATLLSQIVEILHANRLFLTHSHQLALLYGHFMHALGINEQAARYYKAAQGLLVPGSEMRLIVDINLMAAQRGFENLQADQARTTAVNIMADQCRAGTNGALNAVGFFLSSLTDPERVSSKRKLTYAYEICRRGKLNVLYALIFAFTTAQHLFGDRERQLKQLESGREIARHLGGKDRQDQVGQLPLGMWYNIKLRDHYRLDGRFDDEKAASMAAERHLQRIQQVTAYGKSHFPPRGGPM